MTSSFDASLFSPSHFFMFGNRKKSEGAKSGEYGGCESNLQPNSTNFAAATRIGVPAHWLGGTALSSSSMHR
jgi:hypothetical protein